MSKESRRRQRQAGQVQSNPANPAPGAGSSPTGADPSPSRPRASTSPTGTARVGRRERSRVGPKPGLLQRYRGPLIGAAAIAVVALVGAALFSAASQPVFACSNIWEPSPTAEPADGSTPQPGYVQPDMGNGHVAPGTPITFTYCPPASGRHYNASGQGPIQPRPYGPDDTVRPQGWVHNLEHGALIVLYRGDSQAATPEGQAALRSFFDDYPASPVCGFEAGTSVGPLFARFDEMAWPMAAMVWGRVLPMEELDTEAILELDRTFGERTNPEDLCPGRRDAPSPSPSGSAAPSTSPAASPSASAAPSASVAPSASTAPSSLPSVSASPS